MERWSVGSTRGSWSRSEQDTVTLHDVLATIRRQRWLVFGVTLLVTMLAAAYSLTRTPIYSSTAEVLVRSTLTSPFDSASPDLSLQTEARVVTSTAVADIVRTLVGPSADAGQLLDHLSVTVPAETEVLQIHLLRHPSCCGATRCGGVCPRLPSVQVATGERHRRTIQGRSANRDRGLDSQIKAQHQTIGQLVPNSERWLEALRQLDSLQARRISLQEQLATATTLSVDPGQVIKEAELPRAPGSPRHGFDIAMGLFLGLVLGVVAAVARERYRDVITDADALERSIGAPVLGVVPRLRASRRTSGQLIALTEQRSGVAEAYRTLRTNLLAVSNQPRSLKTILVTSAQMREGKTTTAANLAVSLASAGKDVVLMCADLRNPRIHALFGMQSDEGLAQALTGELSIADSLWESSIPHLQVLPSGSVSTLLDPAELLQSGRMLEVLAYCKEAEFVVIDGPPVLGVADSLALAPMVDGVIVVADAKKGTRASVAAAANQLDHVGGRVVGGVLNGFEPTGAAARYGSNDNRTGLADRRLISGPSDGNGRVTRGAASYSDPEATSHTKEGRRNLWTCPR